jgi:hypothetical protein
MNTQLLVAMISATIVFVTAVIGATWRLSSSMGALKSELTTELANLKTEIAVLRERENQRGEKVEQMYQWWLESIKHGWIAHMKATAGD